MERWGNKVAIVTGASAGIGAATAEKLVSAGLQVVGLARRIERVEALSKKLAGKPGKLYAFQADITNDKEIFEAFKWVSDNVGPVSILVNNAGITQMNTLIDGDIEKWRKIFDTNVLGLCVATREAVKIMQKNNIDGHIVHINSILGHKLMDFPYLSVYPASKHAVTALTETLRLELNRCGSKIKVTSISPGLVKTDLLRANNFPSSIDVFETSPVLEAVDVADAIMYALSTPSHVQIHELIIKSIGENC